MEDNKIYYVYIILCENNSYYTGITNDLINRFNKHAKGRGANYTKLRKPLKYLSAWKVENVNIALSVEHYIKSVDKKVKSMFIENNRLLKSYYIKEMKNKKKGFKSSVSIRSIGKKNIEYVNNVVSNNII
ncbi:endonuclease III [Brachyspira suanatina]|uniref:Endonuclease III n=1 Tax=Brachyspira suanatina TaxID=381802 RepID=A0A0G4K5C8_9SPIR|nr:GIY-YIG nuclease family protein [Brachyspira suanatina]CRF32457.1 endonuclease III [Brachyspira suanatina]